MTGAIGKETGLASDVDSSLGAFQVLPSFEEIILNSI
jgi:hypothetical protein